MALMLMVLILTPMRLKCSRIEVSTRLAFERLEIESIQKRLDSALERIRQLESDVAKS
jgi:hypothetical protein